ncbi:Tat binding protein 1-interacting protein-domain-containing protein [Entophlyctis helioformis]|nr:Tat binding protein 1-interacting protein-domain-containing protein [Entophlyctis helioformis]
MASQQQQQQNLVLAYLRKQNRPYNANDIFSNMKGAIAKAALAKLLATCADQKLIHAKQYGKQVIYAPVQEAVDVCDGRDESDAMRAELEACEQQLAVSRERLRVDNQRLAGLLKTHPTDTLPGLLNQMHSEIASLEARLCAATSGECQYSDESCKQINALFVKHQREWAARRKLFQSIWSQLADAVTDSSQLLATLGIETDEDAGAVVPTCEV